MATENERTKKDLSSLIEQNKDLAIQQEQVKTRAQDFRAELEKTKTQYVELSKKHDLTIEERENYAQLVTDSEKRIETLSEEIQGLKGAEQATTTRTEQLETQLSTRDIRDVNLVIYYDDAEKETAEGLYAKLTAKGMNKYILQSGLGSDGPRTLAHNPDKREAALWLKNNVAEFKDFELVSCSSCSGVVVNLW